MAFQLGLLVGAVLAFSVALLVLGAMVAARRGDRQQDEFIPNWRRDRRDHWRD